MLKNRIIPCLDVKNGRVVKGINFVELKDAGDPVEQAKIYSDGGADEICFLDITASNENRETIIDIVRKTAKECFVPLTVGGGVRSIKNITDLLLAGADKVSINTSTFNLSSASISIYPNPSDGRFFITSSEIINLVTIRNVLGSVVNSFKPLNFSDVIDLSKENNGFYTAEIHTNSSIMTKKLIVE